MKQIIELWNEIAYLLPGLLAVGGVYAMIVGLALAIRNIINK